MIMPWPGAWRPCFCCCCCRCCCWHRYLEEEAVKTYSHALEEMEPGKPLETWARQPAPDMAIRQVRMPNAQSASAQQRGATLVGAQRGG